MTRPRALLFGYRAALFEAVPALLSRAGFEVVVIATDPIFKRHPFVSRFELVAAGESLVERALAESRLGYDLVVPGDDDILRSILLASITEEERLTLLPVTSMGNVAHIASKIGLSKALAAGGVLTPVFEVAADEAELQAALEHLAFPVMLKTDFGGAGVGVLELTSAADARRPGPFPLLVQQKVHGELLDLGGFFSEGELVFFSKSTFLKMEAGPFSPSSVRRYDTGAADCSALRQTLGTLGEELGIDGFVNVSAIQSESDGQLYFFEADLRPTVWVEHPRFFGDDPAVAIAAAFGMPRPSDVALPVSSDRQIELSYLPRLSPLSIATNRYNCRAHYPNYLGRHPLLDKLRIGATVSAVRLLRPLLPEPVWGWVMRTFAFVYPHR